jgi:HSP20 family protein
MATVTRWNPVREMITMREAMDQLMNDAFGRSRDYRPVWQLPIDAYTTDDALVLVADVPGLKADALSITLEGDTVTIRGEMKQEEGRQYLLRERFTGKFERLLTINTPIDSARVTAEFENGVLTLTLPKAEAVKPKQIKVNFSQPQASSN